MKYLYGKSDFQGMERAQENCYLLANGLGGYSSLSLAGSCARNDHALMTISTKAPVMRYQMLAKIDETLLTGASSYSFAAQQYVNHTKNQDGYCYLNTVTIDAYPTWLYQAGGVEIEKSVVMKQGENTLAVRYEIHNRGRREAVLQVTPRLQFTEKSHCIGSDQTFAITDNCISSNGLTLYYQTNGSMKSYDLKQDRDLYYAQDARDGRDSVGTMASNHDLIWTAPAKSETVLYLLYQMTPIHTNIQELPNAVEAMFDQEAARQQKLLAMAQIQDPAGQQLVLSADKFLVNRESTGEKTILAGYPFFLDWGRDTMIALHGCCICAGRYEETKSIFRSFMAYCKKGMMPNMFPETGQEPFYNTVDASLLFITSVYEYYQASKDLAFVSEAWPVMESIIEWYQKGTDYHIRMDADGLIEAGSDLEQLTWMDVRYGDILPTPRHGKPVEINAYWYNALKMMEELHPLVNAGKNSQQFYAALAKQVQISFQKLFWNETAGCLKDVISGTKADRQVRCNQIWAVSFPYSILNREQEMQVVDTVYEKLYTPYGLRTLSMDDPEFKPQYGGSQFHRDMSYHQGTVWPFPLGAYYLAYLKVHDCSKDAVESVCKQLGGLEASLREGCVGQIPEVYDGQNPTISKGCFAQAWSVGEILRVYQIIEQQQDC